MEEQEGNKVVFLAVVKSGREKAQKMLMFYLTLFFIYKDAFLFQVLVAGKIESRSP